MQQAARKLPTGGTCGDGQERTLCRRNQLVVSKGFSSRMRSLVAQCDSSRKQIGNFSMSAWARSAFAPQFRLGLVCKHLLSTNSCLGFDDGCTPGMNGKYTGLELGFWVVVGQKPMVCDHLDRWSANNLAV